MLWCTATMAVGQLPLKGGVATASTLTDDHAGWAFLQGWFTIIPLAVGLACSCDRSSVANQGQPGRGALR
jgi:hypothetical protein